MKGQRKDDPYWVEKLWLRERGIHDPTEEVLLAFRKRNKVTLIVFIVLMALFWTGYLLFIHGL
ncbi:MAG: hypothetical protein WBQ76_07550 [Candidatus Korobacteraceae bacterium]